MALKHTFVSPKTDGGDATLVQPSAWNDDHVIDGDGVSVVADTSVPATPTAGFMTMYGRLVAGKAMPAYIGPDGVSSTLQSFLGRNKIGYWSALGDTAAAPSNFGLPAPAGGTSVLTIRSTSATNLFTSMRRLGYVSPGTAGAACGPRSSNVQFTRGSAAGIGGFMKVWRFGVSDAAPVATARMFCGFVSTVNAIANVNPSTLTNMVGLGCDSGETTLSIMHNDGTGAATKVALGANFPADTSSTDMYEFALFCPPNGAEIMYAVTRMNTGDVAAGTLSTDIPVNTAILAPQLWRNNGATALAVAVDFVTLYLETDN